MKKINNRLAISIIIPALIVSYIYKNFFSKSILTGEYINYYSEYRTFLVGIPNGPDTLKLLKNNKFISPYWEGEGTYELSYSLLGTEITLYCSDEYGKFHVTFPITRNLFGRPKIMLYSEKNHHYKKIN